jgi:hypothetical protein
MDEAAQSDDPGAYVLVVQVLEAERDVALRKLALQAAEERLRLAQQALVTASEYH